MAMSGVLSINLRAASHRVCTTAVEGRSYRDVVPPRAAPGRRGARRAAQAVAHCCSLLPGHVMLNHRTLPLTLLESVVYHQVKYDTFSTRYEFILQL